MSTIPEVVVPQPEMPEELETEYDYEENWMNLDDDVIDHLKTRKSAADRDLNPDDIGKKISDHLFNCPLCEINCTGAVAFKMHIEGKQHKSNLEHIEKKGVMVKKKKSSVTSTVAVEVKDRKAKFPELLASLEPIESPLLGLEYVTEFQKVDSKLPQRYVCNLCEMKCDGSTIFSHVVGLKHKLYFFRETDQVTYEHLTKYNSKKRKGELSNSADEFGRVVEKRVGRQDVKVKIEIDGDKTSDSELKEAMRDTTEMLNAKMSEYKRLAQVAARRNPADAGLDEGRGPAPWKKPRMMPPGPAWRERKEYGRGREEYGRDRQEYGREREEYPPRPTPPRPTPPRPTPPRPTPPRPQRDPYDSPYSDPHRRRPLDDPSYERRLYDERRHLDDLTMARHRLSDPKSEQRRLDDILARKARLDALEKTRLDDILDRRKRLESSVIDVARDRLERFERFRERSAQSSTVSADQSSSASSDQPTRGSSESQRPSMEELIARRHNRSEFQSRLEERPKIDESLLPTKLTESSASVAPTAPEDPPATSQPSISQAQAQAEATKALQEEAARNPSVNVGELLTNLSTSMISSEDDAAMALQVSNALTQALLKYRLQNVPGQLSDVVKNVRPILVQTSDPEPAPTLPGLGSSSNSSGKVPAYLRQAQQPTPTNNQLVSSSPHHQSVSDSQGYASLDPDAQNATSSVPAFRRQPQQPMPTNNQSVPSSRGYPPHQSIPSSQGYPHHQSVPSSQGYPPHQSIPSSQGYPHHQSVSSSQGYPPQQSVPSSQGYTSLDPAAQNTASSSPPKPPINTANVDQPQKLLLESIRQQTELLKQRIATQSQNSSVVTSSQAESQFKHGQQPLPETLQRYNPYRPPLPPTSTPDTQDVTASPVAQLGVRGLNELSNWYQQFHGVSAPDAAPAPVPPPATSRVFTPRGNPNFL